VFVSAISTILNCAAYGAAVMLLALTSSTTRCLEVCGVCADEEEATTATVSAKASRGRKCRAFFGLAMVVAVALLFVFNMVYL